MAVNLKDDMQVVVTIKVDIDHYPDYDEVVALAQDQIKDFDFEYKVKYKSSD
tara:strand:+ start:364 stop:519 length:156 start_codon:yes stop_codon:yes gene_type:complete